MASSLLIADHDRWSGERSIVSVNPTPWKSKGYTSPSSPRVRSSPTDAPLGSYVADTSTTLPAICIPVGTIASVFGASGVMTSCTLVSCPWGAIAPSPRARLAWKSRVENTVAADPLVGSSAISDRPALGGWFEEASAGGGSTHLYSGGGASPSRIGRREAGPNEPLTIAPTR